MSIDDKDVEQLDAGDGIDSDCAELIGNMKDQVQVKGDIFSTGIWFSASVPLLHTPAPLKGMSGSRLRMKSGA